MSLNSKIIEYREKKDEQVFESIFKAIHKGGYLVNSLSSKYGLDHNEVESMINLKLISLVEEFDVDRGNFINLFHTAVHRECINLIRKLKVEEEFETDPIIRDDEGNETEVFEIIEGYPITFEEDFINEPIKNRDQRQLIAYLLKKTDDSTKKSISAFLSTDSYRQAAKLAGTCHKTVKARIQRISREFDPKAFGDYTDYLTTAG